MARHRLSHPTNQCGEDSSEEESDFDGIQSFQRCKPVPFMECTRGFSSRNTNAVLQSIASEANRLASLGNHAGHDRFLDTMFHYFMSDRKPDVAYSVLCQRSIHYLANQDQYELNLDILQSQLADLERNDKVVNKLYIRAGFHQKIARIEIRLKRPCRGWKHLQVSNLDLQAAKQCIWKGDIDQFTGLITTYWYFKQHNSGKPGSYFYRERAFHQYEKTYECFQNDEGYVDKVRLVHILMCMFNNRINLYPFLKDSAIYLERIPIEDLQKARDILGTIYTKVQGLTSRECSDDIWMDMIICQVLLMVRESQEQPDLKSQMSHVSSLLLEAQKSILEFNAMISHSSPETGKAKRDSNKTMTSRDVKSEIKTKSCVTSTPVDEVVLSKDTSVDSTSDKVLIYPLGNSDKLLDYVRQEGEHNWTNSDMCQDTGESKIENQATLATTSSKIAQATLATSSTQKAQAQFATVTPSNESATKVAATYNEKSQETLAARSNQGAQALTTQPNEMDYGALATPSTEAGQPILAASCNQMAQTLTTLPYEVDHAVLTTPSNEAAKPILAASSNQRAQALTTQPDEMDHAVFTNPSNEATQAILAASSNQMAQALTTERNELDIEALTNPSTETFQPILASSCNQMAQALTLPDEVDHAVSTTPSNEAAQLTLTARSKQMAQALTSLPNEVDNAVLTTPSTEAAILATSCIQMPQAAPALSSNSGATANIQANSDKNPIKTAPESNDCNKFVDNSCQDVSGITTVSEEDLVNASKYCILCVGYWDSGSNSHITPDVQIPKHLHMAYHILLRCVKQNVHYLSQGLPPKDLNDILQINEFCQTLKDMVRHIINEPEEVAQCKQKKQGRCLDSPECGLSNTSDLSSGCDYDTAHSGCESNI